MSALLLRLEETVTAAEQAVALRDEREALDLLNEVVVPASCPRLAFRALLAEAWARMSLGQLESAEELLERAREVSEGEDFEDAERADVLYRLGATRLQAGKTCNAAALLTLALGLCTGAGQLRVEILERRVRAYLRMREWDAADADVEEALELAAALGDPRLLGHVNLAASNVAQRRREWLLARFHGEHALSWYRRAGDLASAGKVLNNLGAISALMGRGADARKFLADALSLAEERGERADQGYAWCTLARLELQEGDPEAAEAGARKALTFLGNRRDHAAEAANAFVVLGRALAERGRSDDAFDALADAERVLDGYGTPGMLASVWAAQADLAAASGDCERAVELYRQATDLLQDTHF